MKNQHDNSKSPLMLQFCAVIGAIWELMKTTWKVIEKRNVCSVNESFAADQNCTQQRITGAFHADGGNPDRASNYILVGYHLDKILKVNVTKLGKPWGGPGSFYQAGVPTPLTLLSSYS